MPETVPATPALASRKPQPYAVFSTMPAASEVRFREADLPLKQEVNFVGRLLGQVIREQEGEATLELEEEIRALCKAIRAAGNADEAHAREQRLVRVLHSLSSRNCVRISRAFTLYFQLVNLAEQRHRTRRKRAHERAGKSQAGSLAHTLALLHDRRISGDELYELIGHTSIELVLTAHPTQALRRTVLHRLDAIGRLLSRWETGDLTPPERQLLTDDLLEQIEAVWHTSQVRPERLSVLDEVRGTLYYFEDVFFDVIPRLQEELEHLLSAYAGSRRLRGGLPPLITFASWVGGDADGNPNVTGETIIETLKLHRDTLRRYYLQQLASLFFELGHAREFFLEADEQAQEGLQAGLARYRHAWGPPPPHLQSEPAREWLTYLHRRLEHGTPEPYRDAAEFEAELALLGDALAGSDDGGAASARSGRRVARLVSAVRTFGFHLATLDLRNNSDEHEQAVAAWRGEAYRKLDTAGRIARLRGQLAQGAAKATETSDHQVFDMFAAAAEGQRLATPAAVRNYIISMTRDASDVWEVLALAGRAGLAQVDSVHGHLRSSLHPVPLFETIADLDAAPRVLDELFSDPMYRGYLRSIGDAQQVMVGYSDSNKDGGYITSHWLLYQGQRRMVEVAQRHGLQITFFHGRGGTVARGGGRTYEALLALPPGTVSAKLRITEQGEVINSKYADPAIAQRNLELTISGTLLARVAPSPTAALEPASSADGRAGAAAGGEAAVSAPSRARKRAASPNGRAAAGASEADGYAAMDALSRVSLEHYQKLLHGSNELLQFFWAATPIRELAALNIGSRPAFRSDPTEAESAPGSERFFEGLRAIPWVFAWTQCRALMPAWYGLGTALAVALEARGGRRLLRDLYRRWMFFRDLIDNAEMALAKADLRITRIYASLDSDQRRADAVMEKLEAEFGRAVRGILEVTGERHLLQRSPVLRRSIRLRNPYVDPLSYLQVRLLAEKRRGELDEEGERALLLTMHGVAAGMRNTG